MLNTSTRPTADRYQRHVTKNDILDQTLLLRHGVFSRKYCETLDEWRNKLPNLITINHYFPSAHLDDIYSYVLHISQTKLILDVQLTTHHNLYRFDPSTFKVGSPTTTVNFEVRPSLLLQFHATSEYEDGVKITK